jgi:hypothetical protein
VIVAAVPVVRAAVVNAQIEAAVEADDTKFTSVPWLVPVSIPVEETDSTEPVVMTEVVCTKLIP